MRIIYLSVSEIPSRLANSVNVMKMCQAFARHGNDVTLIGRRGIDSTVDPFVYYGCEPIFRIRFASSTRSRTLGKLVHPLKTAKLLRDGGTPDLIYARHVYSLAATRNTLTPVIFEAHVLPRSATERLLQKLVFLRHNFFRLITISNALRQDYRTLFPWLPDSKIVVAHDGADLPTRAATVDRTTHSRFHVGYVGSLYPGKGMEVIAALSLRMPDVDFHVVGGSEEELAHWKTHAFGPNLHMHGFVPHGALQPFYESFDIVLAPFQRRISTRSGDDDIARWTSPIKIFEYMAHRKAIICSDLSVLREVLHHAKTAWLVDPGSIDDWEKAVRMLQADTRLRETLAESALREVTSKYLWEHRASSVSQGLSRPNDAASRPP